MSTNSKNAIQEIKNLMKQFGFLAKDEEIVAEKEIFMDAKLADGTVIKIEGDSLVEGAKVLVVTAEGEIPAPDGVHELEDGSKVEVKDGVIAKIEAEEAEAEAEEAKAEEVVPAGEGDAGIPEEVELVSMLKDFISKVSDKISSMEKQMNAVEKQFSAFKSEPAAKKIADGKTEFNKVLNNSQDDIVAGIMKLRNNNK
jgi:hypothetical protein